jgi:hypothetical protein
MVRMQKLLLVIDDFSELMTLETLFRRLGFDVLTLGKDLLVTDALLRFHPDLVIASQRGRSVDGLKLAMRVKKLTPAPKVAILHTQGSVPTLDPSQRRAVDAMLESPLRERQIIGIMGQLAGVDVQSLLEKYEKIEGANLSTKEHMVHVHDQSDPAVKPAGDQGFDPKKTPGVSPRLRTERSNKYDKFLGDHAEPVDGVVSADQLHKAMKKLGKNVAADPVVKEQVADIDEERQAFAKALFEQADAKTKKR